MANQRFPDPEPLSFNDEEKEEILGHLQTLYDEQIEDRTAFQGDHLRFDNMFRGDMGERQGPWENSANLHIPMPYWLVDSINVRLVSSVWTQTPLVGGQAEEDDDQDTFRDVANLIDWHLQPKRMNARAIWSRLSKLRCIHGFSVGLMSYVEDKFSYRSNRITGAPSIQIGPDQIPLLDEEGEPIITFPEESEFVTKTRYHGPVIEPKNWDDIVVPKNVGMNLQPRTPSNPCGAPFVFVRGYEDLNVIWKKRDGSYTFIDQDPEAKDKDWWKDNAPTQDRTHATSGQDNQASERSHDRHEGRQRNPRSRDTNSKQANPEYEVITAFHPWDVEGPDGIETQECVFFYARSPRILLGAFRLSDISWTGDRPLLEMHYQTVGTRFYSMGVMEIAQHLSAELDTIHNLRLDVGFATNMPFFFYRASSGINPEQIELKPLKGVPVDNIGDVAFPQLQNVTSFYHQEEQLLYTLVERVLGVTDLFLGISPTRGAAARHATGFVGTQQESLARTSDIIAQDAESAAFLFRMIYNMELQFGPTYRTLRLHGKEGPLTQQLSREELWMRGLYDFRLGANAGNYSSMIRQQQGQKLMEHAQWNPLLQQDMGRLWEATNFDLSSADIPNPELYIGPKEAIGPGVAQDQDEENGEMDQIKYGPGVPAPVHPNNNDDDHIQKALQHMGSQPFQAMGSPNLEAHIAHLQMHQQQKAGKAQQQANMQAQAAMGGGGGGAPGQAPPGPGGQDRIVPQLLDVGQMGQMGEIPPQGANGAPPPPNIGPLA